jgi:hypothetical protein
MNRRVGGRSDQYQLILDDIAACACIDQTLGLQFIHLLLGGRKKYIDGRALLDLPLQRS